MHGWMAGEALDTVETLLEDARSGRGGGALIVSGEAGLGISALLAAAAGSFGGRVLRSQGVVVESEIPYSGLHGLIHQGWLYRGQPDRALRETTPRDAAHRGTPSRPGRRVGTHPADSRATAARGRKAARPDTGRADAGRPGVVGRDGVGPDTVGPDAMPGPRRLGAWVPGQPARYPRTPEGTAHSQAGRGVLAAPLSGLAAEPGDADALGVRPGLGARRPASGVAPIESGGPVLAGFLTLLTELAADQPLLVCVDDAHQLDRASREVLGFAARRLGAPLPVAVLLGVSRDRADDPYFAGLPVTTLRPLDERASGALLDGLLPASTDPAVREALLGAGRGNPGLLTDLTQSLTTQQLAGAAPLPRPLPAEGARLRAATARVRSLPENTRTLLLLAAAAAEFGDPMDPATGPAGLDTIDACDVGTVLQAASRAGVGPAALAPAEAARVVRRDGDTLHYTGPLLRRAAYWGESPARRRTAHRLLAWALEGRQRLPALWHSAMAADRPDPALSQTLATAADRARTAAPHTRVQLAGALLAAARLTGDQAARAARLTSAARHSWEAGRPHRARALLDEARRLPAPDEVRGRAELLRGVLELRNGVVSDAREVLLDAARLLGPYDPGSARDALLAAADASWAAGDAIGFREALDRIPELGAPTERGLLDAYRAGMSAVLRGRFRDGVAALRRVLTLARGERDPVRLMRAIGAALVLGELAAARELTTRTVAAARSQDAAVLLPQALEYQVYSELRSGRHNRAKAYAQEGLELASRTGQRNCAAHHHAILAMVAAVEGDSETCAARTRLAGEDAGPHGLGLAATMAQWALARCDLAQGRPQAAVARLGPLVRSEPVLGIGQGHFALRALAVPCFIEAAVLANTPQLAQSALADFVRWTEDTADPQAPAQLARCRALLSTDPEAADALFAQAMAHHDSIDGDFERGRTQLLHGMVLRRRRRPSAARELLRDAVITLDRCNAGAWGDRARSELRATGENLGGEDPRPLRELTPQQLRIARCVAEGATNREVAARLSVSPRTVDHHLRNVFAALGIRSRVELTRFLAAMEENE